MGFNNGEYGTGPVPPVPGSNTVNASNVTVTGAVSAGNLSVSGQSSLGTESTNVSSTTVATPGVPAASTDYTNAFGVDCLVTILTVGTAVSVTTKDSGGTAVVSALAPSVGTVFFVPNGWKINLGAYTGAPTWQWQAV